MYNVGDRFEIKNLQSTLDGAIVELIHMDVNTTRVIKENWLLTGIEEISIPNFMAVFRVLSSEYDSYVGKCFFLPTNDMENYCNRVFENKPINRDLYPHTCDYCDSPAYKGGCNNMECTNINCFCNKND